MPYITIEQSPTYYQITLDDILDGMVDVSKMIVPNLTNTRTTYREQFKKEFLEKFDFDNMVKHLENFNHLHSDLFLADRATLYDTFHIPKKSGGLREINAPVPNLMAALRKLKGIFETEMFASYHTSAFAYVRGRSTIDSIKRHQQNESKWFAKFDFSNFFGSTTEEFVFSMFSMIFPFSEIVKTARGLNALKQSLSLCFLNGGLPQGTPISPIITNVMMIPVDHQLYNKLRKEKGSFVYTRYADDIIISSRYNFDCSYIQEYVQEVLQKFNAPFSINRGKTRYGSSSGRNWNLGVMLNKDNDITIGHKKKRIFKAMCCNYINDKKNQIDWCLDDVQTFAGLISYYKMVERDYINYVIQHNNKKFGVDMEVLIKADLKTEK